MTREELSKRNIKEKDRVRIKMKDDDGSVSEYIGEILYIQNGFIFLDCTKSGLKFDLEIEEIDEIRLAEDNETFNMAEEKKLIDADIIIEKLENLLKAEEKKIEEKDCFSNIYVLVGSSSRKATLEEVINIIKTIG